MNLTLKRNEPFEGVLKFFDEVGDVAVVESFTVESSIPGVSVSADPATPNRVVGTSDSVDSDAIITVTADADLNPAITKNIVIAATLFTRHDPQAVIGELELRPIAPTA